MNSKLNLELNMWIEFKKGPNTYNFEQILLFLTNGIAKKEVENIRAFFANSKPIEAEAIKKNLPAITFTGMFGSSRTMDKLISYTQLIVLDIDDVPPQQILEVKERAKAIENTLLVFISPSGMGIKIVVPVNSTVEFHDQAYNQVCDLYEGELGVKVDRTTKDITRLTFLSLDEECDINREVVDFQVSGIPAKLVDPTDNNLEKSIKYAVYYATKKGEFKKGKRNNFIFRTSCNCNRFGLNQGMVLMYMIEKYAAPDFQKDEITKAVESGYRKKADFNTWDIPASAYTITSSPNMEVVKKQNEDVPAENIKKQYGSINTPNELEIPLQIIYDLSDKFSSQNEKDIFIKGCFTGLLMSKYTR